MNRELITKLYHRAVEQSVLDQGGAWAFEENFTRAIVDHCANVIRPCGCGCDNDTAQLQYDLMNAMKREFGVIE